METNESMLTIRMGEKEFMFNLKGDDELLFSNIITERDIHFSDRYSIKVSELETLFTKDLEMKRKAVKEADKSFNKRYNEIIKPIEKENQYLNAENHKLKEKIKVLKEIIKKRRK